MEISAIIRILLLALEGFGNLSTLSPHVVGLQAQRLLEVTHDSLFLSWNRGHLIVTAHMWSTKG